MGGWNGRNLFSCSGGWKSELQVQAGRVCPLGPLSGRTSSLPGLRSDPWWSLACRSITLVTWPSPPCVSSHDPPSVHVSPFCEYLNHFVLGPPLTASFYMDYLCEDSYFQARFALSFLSLFHGSHCHTLKGPILEYINDIKISITHENKY